MSAYGGSVSGAARVVNPYRISFESSIHLPAFLGVVLGLVVLCLPLPLSAWCPMTTGQGLVPNASNEPCPTEGEVLHWERPCISFAIDERGAEGLTPAELLPAIEQSFLVWTSVTCDGSTVGIQIGALGERSRCQSGEICGNGNVNTVAFLTDWNGSSGVTEVFAQTVTSADTGSGEIFGCRHPCQ